MRVLRVDNAKRNLLPFFFCKKKLGALSNIFALGSNSSGQLGLPATDSVFKPTLVPLYSCLSSSSSGQIKNISSNGNFTLLQVLVEGGNDELLFSGSLAPLGNKDHFEKIELPFTLKAISCGWDFIIAVCSKGQLYGLGSNAYGQLGQSSQLKMAKEWTRITGIPNDAGLNKVSCGIRHVVALDDQGQAWSWGCARHEKLGRHLNKDKPGKIDLLGERVIDVSCGREHTLLQSETGQVWLLGGGRMFGNQGGLRKIEVGGPAKAIHSGWSHILIERSDFRVYALGRSTFGQIPGHAGMVVTEPTLVKVQQPSEEGEAAEEEEWDEAACGSEHTILVNRRRNKVYACGWNEHGNCGEGGKLWEKGEEEEKKKGIDRVWAGCATTFLEVKKK